MSLCLFGEVSHVDSPVGICRHGSEPLELRLNCCLCFLVNPAECGHDSLEAGIAIALDLVRVDSSEVLYPERSARTHGQWYS